MIIQIYHEEEYKTVHDLGFPYIIYTLYRTDEAESEISALSDAAVKDDLSGFTFWSDWAEGDFLEGMKRTGVPLFVHSVSDDVNNEDSIRGYTDRGITGVYTDRTDLGRQAGK